MSFSCLESSKNKALEHFLQGNALLRLSEFTTVFTEQFLQGNIWLGNLLNDGTMLAWWRYAIKEIEGSSENILWKV